MKFFRAGLLNDALKVISGTVIGQAIGLLVAPILTRLYTPEDFGVYTVFLSIASVTAVMSSGKYELAIPLPSNSTNAYALALLSFGLITTVCLVSSIVIFLESETILAQFDFDAIDPRPFYAIPIAALFLACFQVANYWAIRFRDFGNIGIAKIQQGLMAAVVTIAGSFLVTGAAGLILGMMAGSVTGTTRLLRNMKLGQLLDARINIGSCARQYWKFPAFTVPSSLVETIATYVPHIYMASMFGFKYAGLFFLAQRVIGAPVQIVANGFGQAIFGQASSSERTSSQYGLQKFIKASGIMALLSLAALLAILFVSGYFDVVFGPEWTTAGEIAGIMSFAFAAQLMSTPFTRLFYVMQRQKTDLTLTCVRLAGVLIIFLWPEYTESDLLEFIRYYSIFLTSWYLLAWLIALQIVYRNSKNTDHNLREDS